MKRLYLDYNVISYLRRGEHPALTAKLASIRSTHTVVFSPAHLEEIAVSAIRDKVDPLIIKSELDHLSALAGRNALRPRTRDFLVLYDESPRDCYRRVIANYKNNDLAEQIERLVIGDANQSPAGDPRERNNIPPEHILDNAAYREEIAGSLVRSKLILSTEEIAARTWLFSDLKARFGVFEAYVNLSANILEKTGYFRETEEKSRSRLHDVSHIIYGAYCDEFVSADRKLRAKTKAIYSMLKVPTVVLDPPAFLAQ